MDVPSGTKHCDARPSRPLADGRRRIVNVKCVMVGPWRPPVNHECGFFRCVGRAVGALLVSANKAMQDFVRILRERTQRA